MREPPSAPASETQPLAHHEPPQLRSHHFAHPRCHRSAARAPAPTIGSAPSCAAVSQGIDRSPSAAAASRRTRPSRLRNGTCSRVLAMRSMVSIVFTPCCVSRGSCAQLCVTRTGETLSKARRGRTAPAGLGGGAPSAVATAPSRTGFQGPQGAVR